MLTLSREADALTERNGNPGPGAASTGEELDLRTSPAEALTTYRFLRFGILAAVVMLAMSVLYEARKAPSGCWQTSISAYYYTPVRSIFVGGLMVIGFSLIVIRGRTKTEDFCLNLAGMLAPVVALVPTSGAGNCSSYPPLPDLTVTKYTDKKLPEWVEAGVQNNMFALFAAGVFAVLIIVSLIVRGGPRQRAKLTTENPNGRFSLSLLVTIGILGIGMVLFKWQPFRESAHEVAAILMFVFLGVVVFQNERGCKTLGYKRLYRGIWVSMGLSLLVLLPFWKPDHATLWLEILEIGLFAAFWVVETKEQWNRIEA